MEPLFGMLGVKENFGATAMAALEKHFGGDWEKARLCQAEEKKLLEAGDTEAENGNHPWAAAEKAMLAAVHKEHGIDSKYWTGITIFW